MPEPGDEAQERQFPYAPESTTVKPRRAASTIGALVATLLLVVGFFVLAGIVVVAVSLASFGSNK